LRFAFSFLSYYILFTTTVFFCRIFYAKIHTESLISDMKQIFQKKALTF